jgi:hypothetical protein
VRYGVVDVAVHVTVLPMKRKVKLQESLVESLTSGKLFVELGVEF